MRKREQMKKILFPWTFVVSCANNVSQCLLWTRVCGCLESQACTQDCIQRNSWEHVLPMFNVNLSFSLVHVISQMRSMRLDTTFTLFTLFYGLCRCTQWKERNDINMLIFHGTCPCQSLLQVSMETAVASCTLLPFSLFLSTRCTFIPHSAIEGQVKSILQAPTVRRLSPPLFHSRRNFDCASIQSMKEVTKRLTLSFLSLLSFPLLSFLPW